MEILFGFVLSVVAALIPIVIYAWFVNWLDQHEKEPWWLLALAFLWGALPAVILALIAQIILDIPTTWVVGQDGLSYNLVGASVWAPLTEEVFKGIGIIIILLVARREFDSVLDGIVYGAMVGLGFAFTENIFYFGGALLEAGFGAWVIVVLLRTIPFGLNHAFFTGVFGAGLAWAIMTNRARLIRFAGLALALSAAMFFHSLHNLGSTLIEANCLSIFISLFGDWGGMILVGVLIVLIWRQEKGWIAAQLQPEVTADVYDMMTSWPRWAHVRWGALLRGDFSHWRKLGRVRHVGAELAFKKEQLDRLGPKPELRTAIEQYRAQLSLLGAAPASADKVV